MSCQLPKSAGHRGNATSLPATKTYIHGYIVSGRREIKKKFKEILKAFCNCPRFIHIGSLFGLDYFICFADNLIICQLIV